MAKKKLISPETTSNSSVEPIPNKVANDTKPKVRTSEEIRSELDEAKKKLQQAEKELSHAESVEFGTEFQDYYDQTTIPDEVMAHYPNMHFHWVRTMIGGKYESRSINKAKRKGYKFVKIPESCEELLGLMALNSNTHLKNSLGHDVLLNDGGDNVCMMIPEHLWRRRQILHGRKVDSRSNKKAREELQQLNHPELKDGIKESDIYVRRDIRR